MPPARAPPPCRFFLAGTCSAGSSCRFSHVVPEKIAVSTVVCKFWAKDGFCANGDRCTFRHAKAAPAPRPAPPAPPRAVPPPPKALPPIPPPPHPAALAAVPPAVQKAQLGHALYPRVVSMVGESLAGKVTGMMLEMPPQELLGLLHAAPESGALRAAVDRALGVLPANMLHNLRLAGPAVTAPPPRAVPPPETPGHSDATAESALLSISPTPEERAASASLTCGVCLDPVLGSTHARAPTPD